MAGAGYKLFSTGDVLSASDVNLYLQQQTVMVFASAAARTTALASVLAEGMVTYLKDTDVVEIYTGAAWVSLDDPNAIQNSIVDAKGDIISATADNTPARLAVGTNGQVLKANSATATGLEWAADSAGMTNPMTTTGDTIYSSSGSTPARLGIGTTGQVLTVASGVPSWATPSGGSSGPAFSVFRATTAQNFSTGVDTKVQFNGETFDTDNCFDSTTNYRFTPTKAGYYQFNCSLYFNNGSTNFTVIVLQKNGAQFKRLTSDQMAAAGTSAGNSDLVYMNGSSDYIELYVYSDATSPQVYFNSFNTSFSGVWIRS
jgi:hypothetical protein